MTVWLAFFLGMFIGCFVGLFTVALCVAARESDDDANKPEGIKRIEKYLLTEKNN